MGATLGHSCFRSTSEDQSTERVFWSPRPLNWACFAVAVSLLIWLLVLLCFLKLKEAFWFSYHFALFFSKEKNVYR